MEPTRHIIIDNETGDVLPSAVLLTIGAVAVEISDNGLIVLGRWYRRIEWWPLTLAQPARTTSKSTLDWWNAQAPAPFSEAFDLDADRLSLSLAMHSLQAWLQINPYPIWGNGSDFDNAQLQHAFTQHGLRWPYWRNRCLRSLRGTVLQLYPNTKLPDFPADKIKHHALHDAEHEAQVLAVLLRCLAQENAMAKGIPPGYAILPMHLTAENGAKSLLAGEFAEETEQTCAACHYNELQEECEVCGGDGVYLQKTAIEWTTIKAIWATATRHLALAQKPIDKCISKHQGATA